MSPRPTAAATCGPTRRERPLEPGEHLGEVVGQRVVLLVGQREQPQLAPQLPVVPSHVGELAAAGGCRCGSRRRPVAAISSATERGIASSSAWNTSASGSRPGAAPGPARTTRTCRRARSRRPRRPSTSPRCRGPARRSPAGRRAPWSSCSAITGGCRDPSETSTRGCSTVPRTRTVMGCSACRSALVTSSETPSCAHSTRSSRPSSWQVDHHPPTGLLDGARVGVECQGWLVQRHDDPRVADDGQTSRNPCSRRTSVPNHRTATIFAAPRLLVVCDRRDVDPDAARRSRTRENEAYPERVAPAGSTARGKACHG